MKTATAALALLLATGACRTGVEPRIVSELPPIRTDAEVYELGTDAGRSST